MLAGTASVQAANAAAYSQDHPSSDSLSESYRIYSVKQKKEISLNRLLRDLRKADVIFFGEEHNHPVAHELELAVLEGLHRKGRRNVALSMEMFQTDVQLVFDEYLNGLITEKGLERDGRLWKNYADYRPLVEFARENELYVLAANTPGRYVNRVTQDGLSSLNALGDEARKLLPPLPIDTLEGRYYEKFSALMGGHAGMSGLHLYQSQNLWDATMAWRIAQLAKDRPGSQILHVTGRFHSDEKLGTYRQLSRYTSELKCMNISAFSDESFDAPQWDEWEKLGDVVILLKPTATDSPGTGQP